ncbi:hypothetical protein HAHI6034_01455 [Hathewaya histolytica]|uniref:Uncharacterized protein n=1 Tax=Hathewaya histolytica TaxID=1498 RepID=A0A4U9R205_HATHI|nr:Uncharacterised protein [Hathewaya histolytica]
MKDLIFYKYMQTLVDNKKVVVGCIEINNLIL